MKLLSLIFINKLIAQSNIFSDNLSYNVIIYQALLNVYIEIEELEDLNVLVDISGDKKSCNVSVLIKFLNSCFILHSDTIIL